MIDRSAEAIAISHKWPMEKARKYIAFLEFHGVHVLFEPVTQIVCPQCGQHWQTEETGLCVKCTTDRKLQEQRDRDEAEEARLREEAVRAENQLKKERERMREAYDANPRKRSLRQWIEWLSEEPGRLEAVTESVTRMREEVQV